MVAGKSYVVPSKMVNQNALPHIKHKTLVQLESEAVGTFIKMMKMKVKKELVLLLLLVCLQFNVI